MKIVIVLFFAMISTATMYPSETSDDNANVKMTDIEYSGVKDFNSVVDQAQDSLPSFGMHQPLPSFGMHKRPNLVQRQKRYANHANQVDNDEECDDVCKKWWEMVMEHLILTEAEITEPEQQVKSEMNMLPVFVNDDDNNNGQKLMLRNDFEE